MVDIEKARTLLAARRFGALSTQSKKLPGFPFGSLVNYALDPAGRPLFLFSALAVHTKNLLEDPKASFLVYSTDAEENPLQSARLTMFGTIEEVPEEDHDSAQAAYLATHPDAEQYLELGDFRFFRMAVADSYFVAGFGQMGWISKFT
ncbi:MAG: pyridoxamine 5'-phosphate oxidase family protein [Bryobacterales bacterium]|nr:pyridoxamine 5'-phosphate oxidase family protein [Bryobacterales bacterium]